MKMPHQVAPRRQAHGVLGACLAIALAAGSAAADPLQPGHRRHRSPGDAFVHGSLQVAHGNENSARIYYRSVVAGQMKFKDDGSIEISSIKDLLIYFGYANIEA